jgi:hypothetical protein
MIQDDWNEWPEITTAQEMSEGRRTFIKGRPKYPPIEITPAAVDAFERFGTDNYGGIVDTRAGLIAALKGLGIPVKEAS